jgi:hypothetical protein
MEDSFYISINDTFKDPPSVQDGTHLNGQSSLPAGDDRVNQSEKPRSCGQHPDPEQPCQTQSVKKQDTGIVRICFFLPGCDKSSHKTIKKLQETYVAAIEPSRHRGADEELRAIGIRTAVCHRQRTQKVLHFEVLVCKRVAIDTAATSAITASKITTLLNNIQTS